jgi:hypothetical protein
MDFDKYKKVTCMASRRYALLGVSLGGLVCEMSWCTDHIYSASL